MDYRSRAVRWLLGATAHPGGEALTAHLLDRMQLAPGSRVVDVASGSGSTLRALTARGHLAVGLDLAPTGSGRIVVADAHALPLASSSYDAVVCECALSTFARPEVALAEMWRVLRPGGWLGMTDVVLRRDLADPAVAAAIDRLTTARRLSEYAGLLRGQGFSDITTEDRRQDAAALLRRLRLRLPLSSVVRRCQEAVAYGSLGYGLLVARKDPSAPT